jgi:hypothetical protein
MRRFLLAWAVVCTVSLSGCAYFERQREVESTGHGVLLWTTSAEDKAGYR